MYPPQPWDLRGQLYLSLFAVPRSVLPALPGPLARTVRPVPFGRRALVGAAWVRYEPGGVLHYQELLAAVLVHERLRPRVSITEIWVDSVESRDGGRELWGIPKDLATFEGLAAGRPSMTLEGTESSARPAASAVLRRGARLPGRPRVGFTLAQDLHGGLLESPVVSRNGLGLLHADWTFDADGPLGFLAGRRPVVSASLHDFAMLFGMTPHDRTHQRGGHAGVQRQESPHLGATR